MLQANNPIIVPWDFSKIAEHALQHAVKLAKFTNGQVILAHIVDKESALSDAEAKLKKTASNCKSQSGLLPEFVVKKGSIFSAISEVIEEKNAAFAVMGTHGMKGMQKFTGSWALKVIVGSKAPFIVVQKSPEKSDHFDKVVLPIDFNFAEKEKLSWGEYLCQFTKPKIYLTYLNYSDGGFRKKATSNISFAAAHFKKVGIDYEIVKLEGKNLADEAVQFADKINATMLLISTTRNIRIQDYVLGADEQKIIANSAGIPVMCVNPREDLLKTGSFS